MLKNSIAAMILTFGACTIPTYAQVPTAAQDTAEAEAEYAQAVQQAATATGPVSTMMTPGQVTQAMTTLQNDLATGQPLTAPAGVTMTLQPNFAQMTSTPAAANLINGASVDATIGASINGLNAGANAGANGINAGVNAGANGINAGANAGTDGLSAGLGLGTAAAGDPTAGGTTTQFDPSSYLPFQTTTQTSTVETEGGPVTVTANAITGTYANPADPGPTSVVNGLPQTNLDSFVYEAAGNAELIYGDEGVDSIPPYFEFDQTHRINEGITGIRNQGLTTGHGSLLPNAWGGDEFVKTEPWTMSGNNGGNLEGAGIAPGNDD